MVRPSCGDVNVHGSSCQYTCSDRVQNGTGTEIEVDCGGDCDACVVLTNYRYWRINVTGNIRGTRVYDIRFPHRPRCTSGDREVNSPQYAIDSSDSTYSSIRPGSVGTFTLDFSASYDMNSASFTFGSFQSTPSRVTIQGSNDNRTWVNVSTTIPTGPNFTASW
ncbi:MAG: hypothetical protein ACJAYU_004775 [Bradymonadia bacterium]|jgi:hypothetical protein